jgi:hypothetical protein
MPSSSASTAWARVLAAVVTSVAFTATSAAAATLTRGPYLQMLTESSVTIVWNTDVAAECALAIRPLGGSPATITGATGTVCAIPVAGLAPGTVHGYVPRAGTAALTSEKTFETDGGNRPFTFLVVGDSGSGGSTQLTVRDRMLESPADLIVHTGDMIYDNGEAELYDPRFFTPYRDLLSRIVLWPCLGNHDVRTSSGRPWRDAFYTPANNAAGSENYYSFDYGNAHFVVLDSTASTSPGSPQHVFLDADLAASNARWKFVAFHHTIYSSSDHGSNATHRANLVPLFDRHGVDMVFMGHDHDYERTLPLRDDVVVAPGAGTIYVTTGGGGRELYPAGRSYFTAYSEEVHHFTRVSIDDDALLLQMVREDGSIGDETGLVKGTSPTPIRTATAARTATPARTATRTPTPNRSATATVASTPNGQPTTVATPTVARTRTPTPRPTVTPTATPVGRRVDPVADTYIEAGVEATWSHGGSDHLDVDTKPFGVTYIAFDLTAEHAPITRAQLSLVVTNASDDGGSVVRLPFVAWTEGVATGIDATSAGAPGLVWGDVDLNGDGRLDAADGSPLVPNAAETVAVIGSAIRKQRLVLDVTAALQRGPGLYTLAITNASSDGVTFASREDADPDRRPALYLTNGAAPTATPARTSARTPTRTATSVSTPSGAATAPATVTVTRTPTPRPTATATMTATAPPAGRRIEPSADTYIEAGVEATWSHGGSDHLDVDTKPFGVTYLAFDVGPEYGAIARAQLSLVVTNASDDGGRVVRLPFVTWSEGVATGIDPTSAGAPGLVWGDVDVNGDGRLDAADGSPLVPSAAETVAVIGPVIWNQRLVLDVTAAFQRGPGTYTLAITNASGDGVTFASREDPDVDRRPVLYLTAGAATTPAPTATTVSTATGTTARTATAGPPRTATPARTPAPTRTATPTSSGGSPHPTGTPATGGPFASCLSGGGPGIVLNGTLATRYVNHDLAALTRIDARNATFLGSAGNHYPINLAGGAGACIAGGRVLGQYDRTRSWDSMHDENNAGIAFDNAAFAVDGLRVDNATDGIRPEGPGPFTIRHAWLTYVRDDCVENDHVQGGLIEDSLFDGCYVGIAERPTSSILSGGWNGRGQLLTIRRTLIHLAAMPGPRKGAASAVGHEGFFKWSDSATDLALHDNVFMADQLSQGGAGSMAMPATLTSCSNNVMVWLGPGNYPAALPSCFTVTKDRGVWDRAVAAWHAAHPGM